ncbi:hypothetical protein [Pyrinomonas sp.]|uniref:hypothetical protein n=1 Tax=Pyrinomonas sp. TaxID=2080306 RepID=UPI00331D168A
MKTAWTQRRGTHGLFAPLLLALCFAPWKHERPPFSEAQPLLEALRETLPAELRDVEAKSWSDWLDRHDAETRARLQRGEEDTLVNLLLFGTSFTHQPRLTTAQLERLAEKEQTALVAAVRDRARDLVRAASAPTRDERLTFARQILVEEHGFDLRTPAGRDLAERYLLTSVARVFAEHASYARLLAAARASGDATQEFIARSRLYSQRGLSFDTQLPPNYAIEQALATLQKRGLLTAVRRVAIVGPGLDFADKQEGYDIYPVQSIQPFALMDSLLRLGLARADELRVVTFDISRRVNDHLCKAVESARHGQWYELRLPLDARTPWQRDYVKYWETVGTRIGREAPATAPSGLPLRLRALRVAPRYVRLVTPLELNVTVERLALAPDQRFDLIIATNVFVYYDLLDQSLAALNLTHMIRPGGFLLSNNALLELPTTPLRSIGYSTTVYSERPADGDHIVWYQRTEEKAAERKVGSVSTTSARPAKGAHHDR